MQLLIGRERETLLPAILQRFIDLSDEAAGIINVHARVATELSDDNRAKLNKTLESKLGQTVRLTVTQDPRLMGGIILRIGDTVYDGSVQYQLSLLRERMHV